MSEIKADIDSFIEAIRAQRTENADASAKWFSMYMAEKKRREELEAELAKLKPVEPTLEVVK